MHAHDKDQQLAKTVTLEGESFALVSLSALAKCEEIAVGPAMYDALLRVEQCACVEIPIVAGRGREWWESKLFALGFRRHPLDQLLTPYADREHEVGTVSILAERVVPEALAEYPLAALRAERALHMDMTREGGRRSDAHIARYVLARTYVPQNGVVLDAACGLGYGSAVLAHGRPDVQVIGMDNSEYATRYAAENFARRYGNVRFDTIDVCDLSRFADASVDLVVSFETVEHLRNPERFLAEVRRVLKPGGRFLCSVPNMWVDETGKDPNPWHFHVFDCERILSLCSKFGVVTAVYNQTAGGGMKLNSAARSLRRANFPVRAEDEAEWWLVAWQKEPVDWVSPDDTIIVFTHASSHPLYTAWLPNVGKRVEYVTDAGIDYKFPANTALVVTFDCYREPLVTILRRAMEAQIPVLLLADGILEYRNTWEHPQIVPGSIFQPIMAHKMACLGRGQARVLESWGNVGKCEVVGSPRFDRYLTTKRRVRRSNEPFQLLVLTAMTPYFSAKQKVRLLQSLSDLRDALQGATTADASRIEVIWRLTQGIDRELGVSSDASDFTGRELAEVLQNIDAVITTPSTAMVEAMLMEIPVAVLDYCNCPHYVPAAWRITSKDHILDVLQELEQPPAAKMLYQRMTLHDQLECATPASPRLAKLAGNMIAMGREAKAKGLPLAFPSRLVRIEPEFAASDALEMRRYFPDEAAFQNSGVGAMQVEIAHLRSYCAKLEKDNLERRAAALPQSAPVNGTTERTIEWRSKLLAGISLGEMRQRDAAVKLMLDAVKAVEGCGDPTLIVAALTEICTHLMQLDRGRGLHLARIAIGAAEKMNVPELTARARALLSVRGIPAIVSF